MDPPVSSVVAVEVMVWIFRLKTDAERPGCGGRHG